MQKKILFLITLFISFIGNGQSSLKTYVKTNAIAIAAIEPDSSDYADLEFIGNSIGESKMVMLGEQDHGDAPTFLAKTRLIKFLHEKKGFNVLAFESDFFGLNFGFDRLEKSKQEIDTFISKNIFPIWTNCNTCQNLFYSYIPFCYQTENPLKLTGFDNQLMLTYSSKNLVFYLDSLLQSLNCPITKKQNYRSEILSLIDSLKYFSFKDPANYSRCGGYLGEIKNQLAVKLNENDFWMLVLNNLIMENKEYQLNRIDYVIAGNIRDSQMASNLKWLTDFKFPREKIIVWAANAHVSKYIDRSGKKGRKMITMGSFFTQTETLHNDTYVIGFTSYAGEAGRLGFKTFTIRKPQPDGFENWINKTYDYSFVDFRNYHKAFPGKSEQFFLKGLGHNTAFEQDWTTVFDGIFFIREMYPCKRW